MRRRDALDLGRAGDAVLQHDAATQLVQRRIGDVTLDLHQIGLGQLEFGVGDARLEAAVVGKQQQALAVEIEPAGGVDGGDIDIGRQRRAVRSGGAAIGELAEDAIGFVEQQERSASPIRIGGRDTAPKLSSS